MTGIKKIATNKKTFFDYQIDDKIEAGIVLEGCEVKSIRAGHIVLKDAYVKIIKNEAWLLNCYIGPYAQATHKQVESNRDRKLLLHSKEIEKVQNKLEAKGFSLLPVSLYLKKGRVKVQLGLGKSKKSHDKRQNIKDRELKRSLDRSIKNHSG